MGCSVFNYVSHGGAALSLLAMVGCKTVPLDETASAVAMSYTGSHSSSSFGAFKKAGSSSRPIGADQFCRSNMEECGQHSQYHQYRFYKKIDSETWMTIHTQSKQFIIPREDIDNYGVEEKWTYLDNGYGDCEDYQLLNRRVAMDDYQANPNDLMFIIVRQVRFDGTTQGHLIQAANTTDKGWMVSDNLEDDIYSLNDIYNKYPKVLKVSSNLWDWYDIEKYEQPLVAATSPQP